MAWNEIRHRARLVKDYGPLPHVEGSEARLGQVFLNLLVNAAQAIPEGDAEKDEIRVVTRRGPRGEAIVEIRDTGSGMPKAIADRAFDAFFTTKLPDEGTGLGLSICHRIVTTAGGTIGLESEPGKGTQVRIVLPPAESAGPRRATSRRMVAPVRRGRVLIVDDEQAIGTALGRILSSEHEVVVTASADRALARVQHGERFDVVLCDLLMPGLTGMDLHGAIARVDPAQADRIVFMTGGAFTPFARDFLDSVPNFRLEKPFDTIDVRSVVQGVLAW
jgi:CheY-like chemotaxis protein